MKHIGIVGITSEGAALCYKQIISKSQKILGLNIHPEVTLNNPLFNDIYSAQKKKDWPKVAEIILRSIKKLKKTGADFVIIPANSVHFSFDLIKKHSVLPVMSIIESAVSECREKNYKNVLVLGVGITMSGGLYELALNKSGIKSKVPDLKEQKEINDIIYDELVKGIIKKSSARQITEIIKKYKKTGSDAVILACTELPILLNGIRAGIPLIDTTGLLADAALKEAVKK